MASDVYVCLQIAEARIRIAVLGLQIDQLCAQMRACAHRQEHLAYTSNAVAKRNRVYNRFFICILARSFSYKKMTEVPNCVPWKSEGEQQSR